MVTAYIGIGSNLGDRSANIDKGVFRLKTTDGIVVKKISTIYETDPVGVPPQGKFLNGVIEVETALLPSDLLDCLKDIELDLGRVTIERNAPRTIDLDILLYGDYQMESAHIEIPHPRMREREFVLRGLREIAPEVCL